ncbi:MAG: tetratricopeptide repeat protein [Bacteroidetes bacterium]|nr:tetratricopeptide repeat protein [Bacteroidota bacterium]
MKSIFISILLFISLGAFADDNATFIEKGNKAYTSKFYQEAYDSYYKVVKTGYESAELYYNIGNSCFKLNDYPSAILYYEKAKKLKPGDEDINFNLKIANTKIVDKIDAIPEIFFVRWWKGFANIFSFNTWAVLVIIMTIIFLAFFTIYLFSKILKLRKIAFWCALIALAISVKFFLLAQTQYSAFNNTKEAIIFSPSVTAKSSPDNNSTDLFVIHEGTKVKVIDSVSEWSEIKIANGTVGWVNTAVFKVI